MYWIRLHLGALLLVCCGMVRNLTCILILQRISLLALRALNCKYKQMQIMCYLLQPSQLVVYNIHVLPLILLLLLVLQVLLRLLICSPSWLSQQLTCGSWVWGHWAS